MANKNGGFIGTDGLDAPDPPTAVTPTAGNAQVSVAFTAPTDAGTSAITGFVATTDDGNGATGSSSPITITSLTNGTAYTARVYAINAYGTSAPSDASSSFSPAAPRALFFGVGADRKTNIDVFVIESTGNASDFGDLITAVNQGTSVSSSTRGLSVGGSTSGGDVNTIEYVTIAATGSGTDFGDLTASRLGFGGGSNSTRGVFFGGYSDNAGGVRYNTIDYVTIASVGNATDFGDMSASFNSNGATASPTRAVQAGGYDGSNRNQIEYVTIANTGNTTDFGDLTVARASLVGCSSETRGLFAFTGNANIIDYITIASAGNATDFGDLSVSRYDGAATTNNTRAVFGGGKTTSGNNNSNVIDYVTIASTGDASDFGDLTASGQLQGACGSDHGGLQ